MGVLEQQKRRATLGRNLSRETRQKGSCGLGIRQKGSCGLGIGASWSGGMGEGRGQSGINLREPRPGFALVPIFLLGPLIQYRPLIECFFIDSKTHFNIAYF